MDSKNSNSLEELLNQLSSEETENEAESTDETVSETEFEFGASEDCDETDRILNELSEVSEDISEDDKNISDEENIIQEEESDSEYTEPIIREETEEKPEREEKTIFFTRLSGKSEIIRNREKDSDEESESDTSQQEKRNDAFSGPVSDDTPSAEYDGEDDIFRSKRQSFSYRSAAKSDDRTSRTIQNPEDNIRYVNRERNDSGIQQETSHSKKKKTFSEAPETKTDISALENKAEKSAVSEKAEQVLNIFSKIRKDLFGIRNASERHKGIDLKSVPEVDFFSIDVEINEEGERKEKPAGFFRRLNRSFENSTENHLDDYNEPSDASLILDDLYNLKTNLTIKFYIQLAAVLFSVYLSASAMYSIPVPAFLSSIESPHKFSFAMFLVSALVLFSSFPMITGGLKNLFRKKADCDSLAAVSISVCTIAAAVSTESPELIQSGSVCIFAPVAITAFLANTLGKHLIVERAINNFDMLISSYDKHALIYVDDETKAEQLTKGTVRDYPILAAAKKTGFASDFLKYSYSADMADKLCRKLVPASLFAAVVLTLLSVIVCSQTMNTLNFTFAFSMLSMFVSVCSAFGIPLVVNLPLATAASEAEDNESIILGYQSVDDFYDTNSVILTSEQLFPDTSLSLCSVKMYSDTKIDDALLAASSLVINSGSIFSDMFRKIVDNKTSILEKVENFSYEDSLGLCGWIKNKRVLFGTRQLMTNHNIEGIPPKSKEQEITARGCIPMYLSVSGNLAAVFTVKMTADPEVSEYISELTDNGISLIIRNNDSAVTVTRVSRLFRIPADMVKIVPEELSEYCSELTAPASGTSSSVICSGKLSSVTKVLGNIRHIHQSSLTGLVLQSTSALLALLFAVLFMFIGIIGQVTPLMVILYHTVWVFLTMFIIKVKPR